MARSVRVSATWHKDSVKRLTGRTKNYAWGSTTAFSSLTGADPSELPEAEIWYGAHPDAPSLLPDGSTLNEAIKADPIKTLGPAVHARHPARLPFLLKLLAADSPLSIQAHPTIEQAIAGYEAEDYAEIDYRAPNRSFRDRSPKPELLVAITRFEALVGFREAESTIALLHLLDGGLLTKVVETTGLFAAVRWLLNPTSGEAPDVAKAIADISATAATYSGTDRADEIALINRIAQTYPDDPGIGVATLLNQFVLEPGEGVYLDAGTLHAYVGGLGVEIMANSNTVLRGGLTPKHVDVEALLKVLHGEVSNVLPTHMDDDGQYLTPASEFALSVIADSRSVSGPAIVLSVDKTSTVATTDRTVELAPTEAVWLDADELAEVTSSGGLTFVAEVGQ